MALRRTLTLVLLFVLLLSTALILSAQDAEVYADGLTNPRNIAFDSEGNLYVAEAGAGGSLTNDFGDPFGATGQISMITSDGSTSVVVDGLLSFGGDDARGTSAIQVTDSSYWVLLGESPDFAIPFSDALVEIDRENGRVMNFIDLRTIELVEDPDGNPNGEVNPNDFAVAPDGTIYIAGAGCNCLLSWTADDGVQVAVAWDFETDNPVPTSVEVDSMGDIYVGFLTGFPFPEGGSRVEHWSGGELVETFSGLTAITGLLVADDGTIYATEYGVLDTSNFQWSPGRVVMVSADGITPVLEGLTFPFGLAQSPDGTIVVATGAASGEGAGQILVVPAGM